MSAELNDGEHESDEEEHVEQGVKLEQVFQRSHQVGNVLPLSLGHAPELPPSAMGPDPNHDEQQGQEEQSHLQMVALHPADDHRDEEEETDPQHEQPDEAHLRAEIADDRVFRVAELVLGGNGGGNRGWHWGRGELGWDKRWFAG